MDPKYRFLLSDNSLPNDKILDLWKLKVFADNEIKLTEKSKLVFRTVENIAGYQHFLLFHNGFKTLLIPGR